MKKLAIALAAIAAFTAPAGAADMAVRAPVRAPAPVAYAPSWTGCYIGGGGYGLWNQENTGFIDGPPRVQFTSTTTAGGRGYLGTVGGGCDYQFGFAGLNLVVGAFGDYDWSSLKGPPESACCHRLGRRREDELGLGGGRPCRLGGLPEPSNLFHRWLHPSDLRPYQPHGWLRGNCFVPEYPDDRLIDKRTYKGWFLGAGDEYAISFLPGLFWKTEYRFSEFDVENNPVRFSTTGLPSVCQTTPRSLSTRSAASWSIASTGVARSPAGTDLLSRFNNTKSPGIVRGFFVLGLT